MPDEYRIAEWNEHFENASSRKLKRLDWVSVPNKMDGSGYTALVDHPNGAAHLGAWYAIVEIASRQKVRGTLPQGIGGTCRCLGRISRIPAEIFDEVMPRLVEIGWVECIQQDTHNLPVSPSMSADGGKKVALQGMEWKGITEEENPLNPPSGDLRPVAVPYSPKPASRKKGHRTTEEIRKALGKRFPVDRLPWWDEFWKVYPCHDGMNPAMDAFERRFVDREEAVKAYHGAKRYADQIAAKRKTEPTCPVKYAQGWINSERWTDTPVELKPKLQKPAPKTTPYDPFAMMEKLKQEAAL